MGMRCHACRLSRLPAILFIILGLMTLSTVIFSTSNAFNDFAIALKYRGVQIRHKHIKTRDQRGNVD